MKEPSIVSVNPVDCPSSTTKEQNIKIENSLEDTIDVDLSIDQTYLIFKHKKKLKRRIHRKIIIRKLQIQINKNVTADNEHTIIIPNDYEN